MSELMLGDEDALYYEHTEARGDDRVTFVCFNALTGDAGMWKTGVGVSLVDAGHGLLVYNMRGQANSPFTPGTALTQDLIVEDATTLLKSLAPVRPVFIGLSIGGLFAARTALAGAECHGLVLINTLRRDGPRLRWINDAVVRLAEIGGPELLRDILSPLIMNEAWQADNRASCLTADEYVPMDQTGGTYNLLANAKHADWNLAYESLVKPTLVITGKQDRVFNDRDDVDRLFARLPNATRHEIADAGHMVPIEQVETLARLLLDFAPECIAAGKLPH